MGIDTNDGVAVILVDRGGRFLLQLRDEMEGIAWPGVWAIVGGAIEMGESAHDAMDREIEEEIGLRVERLHAMGSIPALWRTNGTLDLFCAGAGFAEESIIVGEGQAIRFFAPDEIEVLERTAPFLKPLVRGFMTGPLYERCRADAS